ncbi:unnamed protein product [Microthlaspi erraticum]|uniref:Uncharacterized protein n=1 Tax=Microthlaspi erraticum TaxID=1685480 RepID=A0A6D2J9V4_9BRAS|nr:unnamed protein product [Microthlaspi erraticum]
MGRFSWLTEASNSSARLVSNDEEDVSFHTSRDLSVGIPSRWYCGFLNPLKMIDHTNEHPGGCSLAARIIRLRHVFAQVKKQLLEIRRFRRVEVTTVDTVNAELVCLFSYSVFG